MTQTSQDAADPIRMTVLRQLAEQAMSDLAFREVARHDLATALTQFGYDLNPTEMALVLRFRDSLEEAGVPIAQEPFDSPFGRAFVLRDPDGYAVTIHDAG